MSAGLYGEVKSASRKRSGAEALASGSVPCSSAETFCAMPEENALPRPHSAQYACQETNASSAGMPARSARRPRTYHAASRYSAAKKTPVFFVSVRKHRISASPTLPRGRSCSASETNSSAVSIASAGSQNRRDVHSGKTALSTSSGSSSETAARSGRRQRVSPARGSASAHSST